MVSIEPLAERGSLGARLLSWPEALARGEQQPELGGRPGGGAGRDDTACFIYTSGTGGKPKGVMLSHGNVLANVAGASAALALLGLDEHEVFLSFLPLSHAYEHTAGQFLPIAVGAQIYYADGLETLTTNLLEARPDDHDLRAAPLRDHAPAHPQRGRPPARHQAQAVRQDGRARQQGLPSSRARSA